MLYLSNRPGIGTRIAFEGMIFHDHFWFEERLPGVQFRWLTPRGAWGGLVHAHKKNQSEQVSRGLVGSEAQSRAQRLRNLS